MKRFIFFIAFAYTALAATAQNLGVEGAAPNLYINHTVVPKDNFYSVGRLYNQSPKVIAAFNNVVMEKGLSIGQHIRIPLTAQNFQAGEKAGAGEVYVPVTHTVAKGENIFKVATTYGITAQAIRQWNLLSSDNMPSGSPIIIGHLKVKTGESALAAGKNAVAMPPVAVKAPEENPKKAIKAPVKDEPVVVAGTTPVVTRKADDTFSKIEIKKGVDNAPVASEPVKRTVANDTKDNMPVRQVTVKDYGTSDPLSKPMEQPRKKIDISTTAASTAEGAFSSIFSNDLSHKSLNTKSGDAATFKSTSGWQDRRYYVLINDVTPGTILKLSTGNSKVIYAKVLGSIPEMKENNGLLLRVSNSAASYLGIVDSRFPVEVSYYQ